LRSIKRLEAIRETLKSLSRVTKNPTILLIGALLLSLLFKKYLEEKNKSELQPLFNGDPRPESFEKAVDFFMSEKGAQFIGPAYKNINPEIIELLINKFLPLLKAFHQSHDEWVDDVTNTIIKALVGSSALFRGEIASIKSSLLLNDVIQSEMPIDDNAFVYMLETIDPLLLITLLKSNENRGIFYYQSSFVWKCALMEILFQLMGCESYHLFNSDFLKSPITDQTGSLVTFDYVHTYGHYGAGPLDSDAIIDSDEFDRFKLIRHVDSRNRDFWITADHALAILKKDGKALLVGTEWPLISSKTENARRRLLKRKNHVKFFQVKDRPYLQTNLPIVLSIIQNKQRNEAGIFGATIKDLPLHDPSKYEVMKSRILKSFSTEKDEIAFSKWIPYEELERNAFSFNPGTYIFTMPEMSEQEDGYFTYLKNRTQKVILSDIAMIFKGRFRKHQKTDEDLPVKLVKSSSITETGEVKISDCESTTIPKAELKHYEKRILQRGDIVLPAVGNIYKIAQITQLPDYPLLPDSNIIVIRADPDQYPAILLYKLLQGVYGKYIIRKCSRAGNIRTPMINSTVLSNVEIPVFDYHEMKVMADELKRIEKSIQEHQAIIQELKKKEAVLLGYKR